LQLYPTRPTFHVAVAAAGFITLGTAARLPAVAAFGGAMLMAIAIGRAVTLIGITRLRAAGFEMVWSGTQRVHRATREVPLVLECEVVNRSRQAVRMTRIHAIASSMLETSVQPADLELAAGTRAHVEVTLKGRRVGRWGVHGLAVRVSAAPLGAHGIYEVPLVFASPLGIEVLPRTVTGFLSSARGARARRAADEGRRGRGPGHADEVRELRDHAPGDPLKRVAWKASARRGRLLVREMERDESDVIWLVVDASIELWAGRPGGAPLDRVTDEVASLATRLLRRGARVGLAVTATRLRTWISPKPGAAQGCRIVDAISAASSAVDADRSALVEDEVARLVADHARPLESGASVALARGDLDGLAARVERLRIRAPFPPQPAFASTARERSLRQHLLSFGIESPPRPSGEREKSEATLAWALEQLATRKPRPGMVYVWAPGPRNPGVVARALRTLQRARVDLRWMLTPLDVGQPDDANADVSAIVASEVARMRAHAARVKGERSLRRLGVRMGASR
jgi:uncharacterized protein (DUF58 family)